jgi:hypothetical protein
VFSGIFTVEMGIKLIALNPAGYVKDPMNIMDGFIVIIAIVEISNVCEIVFSNALNLKGFRSVRILRTLRVARVTRLIRSL